MAMKGTILRAAMVHNFTQTMFSLFSDRGNPTPDPLTNTGYQQGKPSTNTPKMWLQLGIRILPPSQVGPGKLTVVAESPVVGASVVAVVTGAGPAVWDQQSWDQQCGTSSRGTSSRGTSSHGSSRSRDQSRDTQSTQEPQQSPQQSAPDGAEVL